ncbi:MAG: M24 family metallopeptidase [Floccifex sp.]
MAKRLHKIFTFINRQNIDALLIKSKTMKRYIDTVTGSGCKALFLKDKGYLIVDGRYIIEAKEKEFDLEIRLLGIGQSYLDVVQDILKENKCHSMGVEMNQISITEYQKLLKWNMDIRLLEDEIAMIRVQKDKEEIKALKEAVEITDQIYQNVLDKIYVGMSEYEISALLQYYAIYYGAQQMSFDTIVATGPRTALPHGRPTNRRVGLHEPILMDFGIQYKNYQSDITRICFVEYPYEEIGKIYDIVLEANLTGIQAIKDGAIACDVDAASRQVISKAGYGDYFNHGLGHGIGVDNGCELPILNPKSKTILRENMVMSCEPGIYVPNLGGIRIEDDVWIHDGAGIPLNKTTKEKIILKRRDK